MSAPHVKARRSRLRCLFALVAVSLSHGLGWVGIRPLPRSSQRLTTLGAGDGLLSRFVRVAKANINQFLQRLEDPEKVLDQTVDDMQGDLVRVRQSYAEVLAMQRRLARQLEESNQEASDWYRRAQLAVQQADDQLAKEALARRQTCLVKSESLEAQTVGMEDGVEKLFDSMQRLEEKIQQAKEEQGQLIARARTAKATARINEMLSGVDDTGAAAAFDRMKDKVEMMETRAEVSVGLLPSGRLEDRFKQLEQGNVDDELAELKGRKRKSLTAGGEVDPGFEELRRQLGSE